MELSYDCFHSVNLEERIVVYDARLLPGLEYEVGGFYTTPLVNLWMRKDSVIQRHDEVWISDWNDNHSKSFRRVSLEGM